ncbi:MAG: hypothetical protein U9Q81_11420 [Pseudomonadota bacterium]|nr:hypothetical protein [Pseudomonadota bacterium]
MHSPAKAQDEVSFDAGEFEKRAFDFRGYLEARPEYARTNQDGALYQLAFFDEDERASIERFTGVLELEGRYSKGIATFLFRTHSEGVWDYLGEEQDHKLYEGLLSVQPSAGFAGDIGKKAYRWGKGLAWNPVAFVERAKDAGNPDLAREGYWTAGLDWIKTFDDSPLQTIAVTPLIVPTNGGFNQGFGEDGHLNFAGKVYLLYRNTDFDFLFLANGSRTARYGFDFSRNVSPNFEIHGEFAYITNFERIEIDPYPSCRGRRQDPEDVVSYLAGLRYRTEQDITYTLEYYNNGAGNSREQQKRFYQCVHAGWETDDAAIFDRIPRGKDIDRGPFTKPNPMRRYMHARAFWEEPFNILYFTPGVQAFYNFDDGSFSVSPELNYTGFDNFEFRLRATAPVGDTLSEWGEKPNEYKVELRARYYF